MEKIDGHSTDSKDRVKVLSSGDDGTNSKDSQERDAIAQQPDEKSLAVAQTCIFIGISSIENERTQFLAGNKGPSFPEVLPVPQARQCILSSGPRRI